MFIIAAVNNSSLMLAGRKKRTVSGDVAQSTVQPPPSVASDSDSVKPTPVKPVNGDSTSKKAKCSEASSDRASSLDVKSSATGEEASGTVAKVAERRKSELTLTIKCCQTRNSSKDVSSDDDDDDDDDDADDSDSSSSSSSNSEDEIQPPTKRPFPSAPDHKSRTNFPTTAKTTNKKQQSTDSDSSQGSSDTEATRGGVAASSSASATVTGGGGGQTPSKATKRRRSVNSPAQSRKRRRRTSTDSQVGCESTLAVINYIIT